MAAVDATVSRVLDLAQQLQCKLQSHTENLLARPRAGPQRHLFPVGSFALGIWHPGDEVHLVCLTDNSPNTFWEYAAERLEREDLPKFDCPVTLPEEQATIWLHYCRIPPGFDPTILDAHGFPNYPRTAQQPKYIEQNLARLQDAWALCRRLRETLEPFRSAYQALRKWAEAAGILSEDFGTLNGDALLWMLFNVDNEPASNLQENQHNTVDIIRSFTKCYQTPESLNAILTPSGQNAYTPSPEIADDNKETIAQEIDLLAKDPTRLDLSREDHYQAFCNRYDTYMLVSAVEYVGPQRGQFHHQLVKEIPSVARRLGEAAVHIWPHAFKPSDREWMYVLGINRLELQGRQSPFAKLTKEATDSIEFNINSSIGAACIYPLSQSDALCMHDHWDINSDLSWQNKGATNIHTNTNLPVKFPPAAKILSRLRWDPAHYSYKYEVGYKDRFEGLLWMPLEDWGRETEEEDFIPEHRIEKVRRVIQGGSRTVVYDRVERVVAL
ncbi:hypothetical protein Q7P37_004419 [Cladosporium fusiforme]